MSKVVTCPLWREPAWLLRGSPETVSMLVWSARAGGRYGIDNDALDEFPSLNNGERARITNWLVDQRRLGEHAPFLSGEDIETILKGRDLRFSEKRDRFWRMMSEWDIRPGEEIPVNFDDGDPKDMSPREPRVLWASMGVQSAEEGLAIVAMLANEGYLNFEYGGAVIQTKGFEKLEAMSAQNGHQAFVAMWFDDSMREAWRLGFAPAIRDAGYDPFRIDNLHHNGKIDDAIVAEIKKSRFLIADFTCGGGVVGGKFQPNPRGGVYYEAGLAHGLGMEVIFTCREDRLDYLHFDTRQFAHIVWKSPDDLRAQLYNRIAATLKEAPGAPGRGSGAVDPAPE